MKGLPPAVYVSAGSDFTCAVDSSANVWCWGDDEFGQLGNGRSGRGNWTDVPQKVKGLQATQVSAGGGQACALTTAATVSCWGEGNEGGLGNGTTTNADTPQAVKNLIGATQVAAGGYDACALTANGAMECWGDDLEGQLGDGHSGKGSNETTPVNVTGLDRGVVRIGAGTYDTCAELSGGDLKCWGENSDGQLGTGTTTEESVPTQVRGLVTGVTQFDLGQEHTCAIVGGDAECWGIEADGVLGNGSMAAANIPVPTPVFGLETPPSGGPGGPLELAAGFVHTCVLNTEGNVACWGAGFDGQLGSGNLLNHDIPTPVVGLPRPAGEVDSVDMGYPTACALNAALGIDCWGYLVGNGSLNSYSKAQSVTDLPTGSYTQVSAEDGACALSASGHLACWGLDKWGEVGNGTTEKYVTTPTAISLPGRVEEVSRGGWTTCALVWGNASEPGVGYCWGDNAEGGVGDGSTSTDVDIPTRVKDLNDDVTQIAAGGVFGCALLKAGLVQCWGDNRDGDLGDNSTIRSSVPVTVSGLTGVVQLALGVSFGCALLKTGAVECWGENDSGSLGNGLGVTSHVPVAVRGINASNPAVSIAAGTQTACATLRSGAVECWGDNTDGELGNGSSASDSLVPVAVSGLTSNGGVASSSGFGFCALDMSDVAYCWGSNTYGQLGDGKINSRSSTPVQVEGLS